MENRDLPAYPSKPTGTFGISKREYFAGLALQGLLSLYDNGNGLVPNTENVEYMAGLAVTSADALLGALKKSQDTSNPK